MIEQECVGPSAVIPLRWSFVGVSASHCAEKSGKGVMKKKQRVYIQIPTRPSASRFVQSAFRSCNLIARHEQVSKELAYFFLIVHGIPFSSRMSRYLYNPDHRH